MLFRKKPVVIDAVQWTGKNVKEIEEFLGDHKSGMGTDGNFYISTLEGPIKATKGDWIIQGVAGEFYPCKPDIFERTYEKAESTGKE